jgi:transcriptional regulator with XRE-family HTH domain
VLSDAGGGDREATQAAARASRKVALALSFLQRHSGLPIKEVAQRTGLSPSYVSRILSGDRLPTWSAVQALAEIFEGDAADLRLLWEAAQGLARSPRPSLQEAIDRLSGALRGMYLAAGCPPYDRVSKTSAGAVEPAVIEGVLTGRIVPCWETTSTLLTALNARPSDVRGLWEDANYAFLVCLRLSPNDSIPPDLSGPTA